MKTILRYFWYREKYALHRSVNGFFYYLRKLPLVGKSIPESIFKSYSFKSGLFLVLHILSIPSRFLVKGFWLVFHFYHASFWMNILASEEFTFWNILPGTWLLGFVFWFLFVGLNCRFSKGLDPVISKADREFMQNFDLSQSTFLQSQLFIEPILTTIYYLPALVIFCLMTNQWLVFPVGMMTVLAGHLTGHALNRWFFEHRMLTRRNSWHAWLWGAFILVLYVLTIVFRHQLSLGMLIPILLVQPFLIWFSYGYLKRQTNHLDYLSYCMDQSLQMDKKIVEMTKGNEYTRQGLQMQAKLNMETGKDLSHLSGMTYLNALLFDRYRSILTKKLLFRLGCLLAIILFLEGIRWFSKEDIEISNANYIEGLPFTFMVMYAASMGKAVAQMVFVNCDISMLHYPFYREAKTIIAGFHYRFLQTVKLNAAFSGSLLLALIIFTRAQLPIETYLLTALLLLSLTALFSFHDLFIYYILQPFTKDMEVVNPVYKFLSGPLYWVAYLNIKLELGSHLYILLISLTMIAYVSIGYWILLKKAPQTFRLKA
ncbi:hypothetical protein NKE60_08205 [Streptococcus suis]|uniref:hypothetical protein n=1 Tax=Streptococcus suis TaxID=1307 RepID=UPI00209B2146|nr:hypothetical protein [Streptococcus suis]MCO8184696.1 hypothetical protein [Streptococcus suis]MCO8216262.1 hypothetical protein [Streptococcus suis]HEM3496374.1 hypothetical protein [Streptococcus suis]HEM3509683.1 hypothetical protein [Streptococcus suis]